jgi:anthranilate phosphoribosyltransferase
MAKLEHMNSEHNWLAILDKLKAKQHLTADEAKWSMQQIMNGEATEEVMSEFLLALNAKGEHITELSSFVDVMLEYALPIPVSQDAIDIVGTGGDQLGTVNISSMAAIVAASTGYPVLKHGSRSASGKTGSSEMLESLGVRLDLSPEQLAQVFSETGITFFFAPMFHPSLKNVGPTRKKLGVPTTFNFLGPLANPAQPVATALGVAKESMAPLMAAEMAARGRTALVFRGSDGLDELTTTGNSKIWVVFGGKVSETTFNPADIGIKLASVDQLLGGNPQENAAIARDVFSQKDPVQGDRSAIQDIVALNAAAGMAAYDLSKMGSLDDFNLIESLAHRYKDATAAIDQGKALAKLNQWVLATQQFGE